MDEQELRRLRDYFRTRLDSNDYEFNFEDLDWDADNSSKNKKPKEPKFIFPIEDVSKSNLKMLVSTMESLAKGEKPYLIDIENFGGFYALGEVPENKDLREYKVVWLPDMVAGLLRKRFDKIEETHKAIEEARTKGFAEIADLEKRIEKILTIGNDFLL